MITEEEIKNLVDTYSNKYQLVINRIYKEQYVKDLEQENQQLKSTLEEIREYIKEHIEHEYRNGRDNEFYLELNQKELNDLLQIIDKGE